MKPGTLSVLTLVVLLGVVPVVHAQAPGSDDGLAPEPAAAKLHPVEPVPVPAAELEAAIGRGIAFLLQDQNPDGSWGSPERTKDLNIIAGVGSHQAFRTAVTALCVSALIETGSTTPEVQQAIERGEAFLFREIPKVRRNDPMLIYNVWAHAYGIQALVDMHRRVPGDATRQARIVTLIQDQFDRLKRYESVEGGWGYYDFEVGSQRPKTDSTSFVNATVLIALHEAKQIGVEPPQTLTARGIESTERQKLPDFSYLYGTYLRFKPRMGINRPAGSLGRSQACNLALRLWGDASITDTVLTEWLDRLISRNGWLSAGRKKPVPHESFFQVAGYFYYYGHYYAGLCVAALPPVQQPFYQHHLARILMGHQEPDGSWWDYPLYNYHQQYGTAYALMALHRCRLAAPAAAATPTP